MSRCIDRYEAEIDGEYPADLLQIENPMDERLMGLIDQIEARYPTGSIAPYALYDSGI